MSSVECPVVIPYFGGKYEMSRKMVHMIPEHERYIEVFFGGGSMFFRKPKAKFNVLNDIDSDLINLYLCVLDKFDELKKYIYWYPKSRSLHEMFREEIKEDEPFTIPDVERASKYYYTVKNSFNRIPTNAFSTHSDWDTKLIKELEFSRMKLDGATIENLDFKTLIERHSPREGDFYYLDPPYIVTEKRKDYYRNVLNRDEHIELKEVIDTIDDNGGYVMISYDNHDAVRELYSSRYNMNTIDTKYVGTMSDKNGRFDRDEIKTELLITNYNLIGQEELFI
jgi:DNA adenine methylase|tara:strand:- start:610 stop:1452 length:843 start_codon:yes stop_codon:yes gene_type:complete